MFHCGIGWAIRTDLPFGIVPVARRRYGCPREASSRAPARAHEFAVGGTWLVVELDGGRVYLDDGGNLFALPAHAAIRDRFVDASGDAAAAPPRQPDSRGDRLAAAVAEIHRPRLGCARRLQRGPEFGRRTTRRSMKSANAANR